MFIKMLNYLQNQDENNNGSLRNISQHVQSPPLPLSDCIKTSPDTLTRENYGNMDHSHSPFVDSGSHERPPSHPYDSQQASTSAQISPHEISMSSFHLQEIKKNVSHYLNEFRVSYDVFQQQKTTFLL